MVDPLDRRGVMCGGVVVLLVRSWGAGDGVQAHLTQRHLQLVLSTYTEKQQGTKGHGDPTPRGPTVNFQSEQIYGTADCTGRSFSTTRQTSKCNKLDFQINCAGAWEFSEGFHTAINWWLQMSHKSYMNPVTPE